MTSPSEDEGQEAETRNVFHDYADPEPDLPKPPDCPENPKPCPECKSTRGYTRIGNWRVQCLRCNALLKNDEVDMQLPNEETR